MLAYCICSAVVRLMPQCLMPPAPHSDLQPGFGAPPLFREALVNPFNCSQSAWLCSSCLGSDALHTSQPAVNKVIMS